MSEETNNDPDETVMLRARRAQLILYLLMFVGMALPFLVAWWSGHIGPSNAP